jgi:hypothetical protein
VNAPSKVVNIHGTVEPAPGAPGTPASPVKEVSPMMPVPEKTKG